MVWLPGTVTNPVVSVFFSFVTAPGVSDEEAIFRFPVWQKLIKWQRLGTRRPRCLVKWFMEPKFQSSEATTSKAVSSHFKSRTTASPWSEDSYDQTDFKLLPEFKTWGFWLGINQWLSYETFEDRGKKTLVMAFWPPQKWNYWRLFKQWKRRSKVPFDSGWTTQQSSSDSFISILPSVSISNALAMLLICISVSTRIRAKHVVVFRPGMNVHLEPAHHQWIALKCDLPRPIHTDHLAGNTFHNTSMKEMEIHEEVRIFEKVYLGGFSNI